MSGYTSKRYNYLSKQQRAENAHFAIDINEYSVHDALCMAVHHFMSQFKNNTNLDSAKQLWTIILNLKDCIDANDMARFQTELERFYENIHKAYYEDFSPYAQSDILDEYADQYKKFNVPVLTFDDLAYEITVPSASIEIAETVPETIETVLDTVKTDKTVAIVRKMNVCSKPKKHAKEINIAQYTDIINYIWSNYKTSLKPICQHLGVLEGVEPKSGEETRILTHIKSICYSIRGIDESRRMYEPFDVLLPGSLLIIGTKWYSNKRKKESIYVAVKNVCTQCRCGESGSATECIHEPKN